MLNFLLIYVSNPDRRVNLLEEGGVISGVGLFYEIIHWDFLQRLGWSCSHISGLPCHMYVCTYSVSLWVCAAIMLSGVGLFYEIIHWDFLLLLGWSCSHISGLPCHMYSVSLWMCAVLILARLQLCLFYKYKVQVGNTTLVFPTQTAHPHSSFLFKIFVDTVDLRKTAEQWWTTQIEILSLNLVVVTCNITAFLLSLLQVLFKLIVFKKIFLFYKCTT